MNIFYFYVYLVNILLVLFLLSLNIVQQANSFLILFSFSFDAKKKNIQILQFSKYHLSYTMKNLHYFIECNQWVYIPLKKSSIRTLGEI